jgi:putative DNA methylase
MTQQRRKLIEVALPLEAINRESAREKSIRHGHPSTLHLWWARRPLAAARAVLFAQLVDDPSARPEEFPTQEAQDVERKRLFDLIERLVLWDNTNDEKLFAEAHAEILRSTNGKPPPILDPFAGGGSIPLEAQRLGLEAHASDLNPVAVLINKALIEIPPRFAGRPPVFPGAAATSVQHWPRATGLAEDVRRYSAWMRDEARSRIGHIYPQASLPDGTKVNVIAWIWVRTVTCPNPACGAEIPMASTWWLSKKKDRPTWIQPVVTGKRVDFEIKVDKTGPPDAPKRGRGAKFTCIICNDTTTDAYVKAEAMSGRMAVRLLAVVAEGNRRRVYLPASETQTEAANVPRPADVPDSPMPTNPRWFSPPAFGLMNFADLFTARQLVAMTTFSDLVGEAQKRVRVNANEAGMPHEDAQQYADAVALYLAFGVDKLSLTNTTLATWQNSPDRLTQAFSRQAVPMTWDFAEANPMSDAGGGYALTGLSIAKVLDRLPGAGAQGYVEQADASKLGPRTTSMVVATDPPYYDNIGYADLSDYFYVWLRRSVGAIYPSLTGTMLTPKSEELVATPYRFGGSKARAEEHFERGFVRTFTRIRALQTEDVPITIFYAFKQAESDVDGIASTGWETMLNGLIEAGLSVTATWPMRTELVTSLKSNIGALASSIVLACRPRPKNADATTRRGFIAALKDQLPRALRELQQGSVAPVDLAQAAIGPGMAVFTRYSRVVEADGAEMTVRTALALINQVLDETLSEQEGDFDSDTRFCVKWFGQYAWDETDSGTADVLARATNTSIEGLQRGGVFRAVAGKARLLSPDDLSDSWDPLTDVRTSVWEVTLHLAKAVTERGSEAASALMGAAGQRVDLDAVKELAYLLYNICERKGWTTSALLFNGLGTSWSDLDAAARASAGKPKPVADTLNFDEEQG